MTSEQVSRVIEDHKVKEVSSVMSNLSIAAQKGADGILLPEEIQTLKGIVERLDREGSRG